MLLSQTWHTSISGWSVKSKPPNFITQSFIKSTDFRNSFAGTLRCKFAIEWSSQEFRSLVIPPHLKRVATLPCKYWYPTADMCDAILLQIYCWVCQINNFENRSIFDKVISATLCMWSFRVTIALCKIQLQWIEFLWRCHQPTWQRDELSSFVSS